MNDVLTYFITWCTYGAWLPGDARNWRKRGAGQQLPRPLLEKWCRERMRFDAVLLRLQDRPVVEEACREHCEFRGWTILAISARSNHVHAVVVANENPKIVRNQLKANGTRLLRTQADPLVRDPTWAKGGDIEILDDDESIHAAVAYVLEGQ